MLRGQQLLANGCCARNNAMTQNNASFEHPIYLA